VAEEDRFYLDMEPVAERKIHADHMIQKCAYDLSCVDNVIHRDNPDVKFKDYDELNGITSRVYGVDRTKYLVTPYGYGIGIKFNKAGRILEYKI
jgi:hypothetical protein